MAAKTNAEHSSAYDCVGRHLLILGTATWSATNRHFPIEVFHAPVSPPTPAARMGEFMRKVQARRVNSKYSMVRKLGEGGHGAVYLGMRSANLALTH